MMANLNIPETINNFNVYKNGTQLIGLSGEITLPDFEPVSDTVSGAGILGEFETSIIGMFSSMKMDIPFRILNNDIFTLMNPTEVLDLTFRASAQYISNGTGALSYKGMRVVVRGKQKTFKQGSLKQGAQMNASVSIEVLYILIEIDGTTKIELDKLNSVYKVNGVDLLAQIKKQC